MDAFAFDFCEQGKWERERPVEPPALVEIGKRRRAGREVVHLAYHRLSIDAETKGLRTRDPWRASQLPRLRPGETAKAALRRGAA